MSAALGPGLHWSRLSSESMMEVERLPLLYSDSGLQKNCECLNPLMKQQFSVGFASYQ